MGTRTTLAAGIFAACVILPLAAGNAGELVRLYKTGKSIRHYREIAGRTEPVSARHLAELRDRLAALEQAPSEEETGEAAAMIGITGAGEAVRSLLLRHDLQPERLRTGGRGTGEFAEFVLRCNPEGFFGFLAEVRNHPAVITNDISIKPVPGSPLADITLRVKTRQRETRTGIAGKTAPEQNGDQGQEVLADPRSLARSFRLPRSPEKTAAVPGRTEPPSAPVLRPAPPPPLPPVKDQVTLLGIIRDGEDAEWLYVKERESGRILRIAAVIESENENRLISAGPDHYVVQIGEKQFITGRPRP
jgi:hypothetical protein